MNPYLLIVIAVAMVIIYFAGLRIAFRADVADALKNQLEELETESQPESIDNENSTDSENNTGNAEKD